jgi:DNA gyrase subunit A
MDEYRVTNRGGKGIITMKITDRTGPVVGVLTVTDEDQLMLITNGGTVIRTRVAEIRVAGRNTMGVRLINLEGEARVVAVARLAEPEGGEPPAATNGGAIEDDGEAEDEPSGDDDDPV